MPIFALAILTGAGLTMGIAARLPRNPLATTDQKEFEQKALRILGSPAVQQQRKIIENAFQKDVWANTPEGKATFAAAINELLFNSVIGALNSDPGRPEVEWVWAPAHSWFGLDVPAAKFIMPNVDNVFRVIPVDDVSHYEIVAHPQGNRIPTQWTVQLIHSVPDIVGSQGVYSVLIDTDIIPRRDGSFTLTVGPEPGNGQLNHLQTVPGAGLLLIRDTIADWQNETPYRLEVRRVDGPALSAAQDDSAVANEAAELVKTTIPLVVKFKESAFQGPANAIPSPHVREGGRWGLATAGHFKLADDEALILTLDPIGAKYLSVQLANRWLGSLDYIHHTASLNITQAEANSDGSYTFVIAPRDPGSRNWVDTMQLHEGVVQIRWQKLPQPLEPSDSAVRSVKVVKLNALEDALPRGTTKLSAVERRKQLAVREEGYARRFAEQ